MSVFGHTRTIAMAVCIAKSGKHVRHALKFASGGSDNFYVNIGLRPCFHKLPHCSAIASAMPCSVRERSAQRVVLGPIL